MVLAASGCYVSFVGSTFVPTDGRAVGRPATRPTVFIDRLPPVPFYSVGIIEIQAPAGVPLDEVLTEAIKRGGQVGCDFVVDRAIYRVSLGIPEVRAVIAQVGTFQPVVPPPPVVTPAPTVANTPPPSMREFVCGVTERPGVAHSPPVPLPPKAPAPPPGIEHPAHVSATADARTAPADVAPRLATLAVGQPVIVVGDDRDGWFAIKLPDGRTGYIRSAAIQVDQALP